MKLGNAWNTDPRLKNVLHKFDAAIVVLLGVGIVWFIWTHWKNRAVQSEV
jgi:hypothetical protein